MTQWPQSLVFIGFNACDTLRSLFLCCVGHVRSSSLDHSTFCILHFAFCQVPRTSIPHEVCYVHDRCLGSGHYMYCLCWLQLIWFEACDTAALTTAAASAKAVNCLSGTGYSGTSVPTAGVMAMICKSNDCMETLTALAAAAPNECLLGGKKLHAELINPVLEKCKAYQSSGSTAGSQSTAGGSEAGTGSQAAAGSQATTLGGILLLEVQAVPVMPVPMARRGRTLVPAAHRKATMNRTPGTAPARLSSPPVPLSSRSLLQCSKLATVAVRTTFGCIEIFDASTMKLP